MKAFYQACQDKDLDAIKKYETVSRATYMVCIEQLCRNGFLEGIKHFIYSSNPDFAINSSLFDRMLKNSIMAGQIHITKFLISLIDTSDEFTCDNHKLQKLFAYTCHYNQVDTARYLLSLEVKYGQLKIYYHAYSMLSLACRYNSHDMIGFLLSLDESHGPLGFPMYQESFINVCKRGSYQLVQYMVEHFVYEEKAYQQVLNDVFREHRFNVIKVLVDNERVRNILDMNLLEDDLYYDTEDHFKIRCYLIKSYPNYDWTQLCLPYNRHLCEMKNKLYGFAVVHRCLCETGMDIVDENVIGIIGEFCFAGYLEFDKQKKETKSMNRWF